MRFRFFSIPVHSADDAAKSLNQFLAVNRFMAVDRQFVPDGSNSTWAVCVTYDDAGVGPAPPLSVARRAKADFKDVFDPAEFAVFARLRALRKERSDADGVPAYAVFTNDQLAEMVRRRITSATALQQLAGVGEARVAKYGPGFLSILLDAALPEPEVPVDAT